MLPVQYLEYRDVFSEELANHFPPSQLEDHRIQIKEGAPEDLKIKVYLLTRMEKDTVKKYLRENKERGFIEKSNSPWASPMFFIKKADKGLRPVVDYQRRVND